MLIISLQDTHTHIHTTPYRIEVLALYMFDDDDENDCGGLLNLQDLFTNTSYREYEVHILSSIPDPMHVKLLASPSATTDPELTGQVIWPISTLLGHYIASPMGRKLIYGKNVIELGAGCGLPGIVASKCGANHVTFTDGNEVVVNSLLQQNAVQYTGCPTSVSQFVWGNIEHLRSLQSVNGKPFDIVLAADVVQWPAVVEPLLHSIKALLWDDKGGCDRDASNQKACVLGIVQRSLKTSSLFFRHAKELGFEYSKIDMETLFPSNESGKVQVPAECCETGGLETELFIIKLVDKIVKPILFTDQAQNLIVGKAYENTSYMPC